MVWLRDAKGRLVRTGAPPPRPTRKKKSRVRRRCFMFAGLPTDVLARIWGWLSPAEDPRQMLLARSVSRGFSKDLTAVVKKTWTRVDTHLVEYGHQLRMLRAAVAARCVPRELVVASLSDEDARMTFSWLIDALDTSQLTRVSLKSSGPGIGNIIWAMQHDNNGSVDLTESRPAPLSFRGVTSWHGPFATSVLDAVGRISSLRQLDLKGANKRCGSLDNLSALRNLEHLGVTVNCSFDLEGSRTPAYSVNYLSLTIRRLKNLRTLDLFETGAGSSDRHRMLLGSASLRVLNILGTQKHFCFTRIDCPSLTEFHCTNSTYGTGVRRVLDGQLQLSFFDENATSYDPLGRPSRIDMTRLLELNDTIADSDEYRAYLDAIKEKSAMLKHLSIPAGTNSWSTVLGHPCHLPPACEVHFHS